MSSHEVEKYVINYFTYKMKSIYLCLDVRMVQRICVFISMFDLWTELDRLKTIRNNSKTESKFQILFVAFPFDLKHEHWTTVCVFFSFRFISFLQPYCMRTIRKVSAGTVYVQLYITVNIAALNSISLHDWHANAVRNLLGIHFV